jgi:hypothetical protein
MQELFTYTNVQASQLSTLQLLVKEKHQWLCQKCIKKWSQGATMSHTTMQVDFGYKQRVEINLGCPKAN